MKSVTVADAEVLVEESDKYLQVNNFSGDFAPLWQELSQRYPGYEAVFCFHEREAPSELREVAELQDDCVETRLKRGDFTPRPSSAERLTSEKFAEFAALHDRLYPDIYWTSERVLRSLGDWAIFLLRRDGAIVGYVMTALWGTAEVFALHCTNASEGALLLSAAAEFAFNSGKSEVLFMADRVPSAQLNAALEAGFSVTGTYQSYRAIA